MEKHMLTNPEFAMKRDIILDIIAEVNGREVSGPTEIETGVFEIPHFSFDMLLWGRNNHDLSYPHIDGIPNCFGVCDSPAQFLARYRELLQKDERPFVVSMTHIAKKPGESGGWRWHKWGPYIGEGHPTQEHLDDEKEFENGVYVYHIYQLAGPEKEGMKT
jgi:hypothetical protein